MTEPGLSILRRIASGPTTGLLAGSQIGLIQNALELTRKELGVHMGDVHLTFRRAEVTMHKYANRATLPLDVSIGLRLVCALALHNAGADLPEHANVHRELAYWMGVGGQQPPSR